MEGKACLHLNAKVVSEEAYEQVRVPQNPHVLMDFVDPRNPGGLDLVPHSCDGMDWDLRSLLVDPIEQGLAHRSYVGMDWDLRRLSVGMEGLADLLSLDVDWDPQNCAAVDWDQGIPGSEQGYWKQKGF